MTSDPISPRVLEFLDQRIDSVPHLEALLLLWSDASKAWSEGEISERLYVTCDGARALLHDLARHRLAAIQSSPEPRYCYDSRWDGSETLMDEVAHTYRRHLVHVTRLIHNKGSPAVRDFARAFDFKSD